jgi:hypothetical protein
MGFSVAMEDFKLVRNFEFFEEPEYTLLIDILIAEGSGLPVELDFCFFDRRNRIRCHCESNDM